MEQKMQRKIYGAVLMLASSAFGLDRWALNGGPSEGQAMTSAALVTPVSAPESASPRATTHSLAYTADNNGGRRTLAARLQEAAAVQRIEYTEVQDAFRIPPALVAIPASTSGVDAARQASSVEFTGKHRLTAVMTNSRGGMAMIDGKTYMRGQAVDGYTIVTVRPDAVVLENGSAQVQLAIEKSSYKNQ